VKISVDGAELHCTTLGSGPPCVILSAIGTKPYLRMTSAALGNRHRLVCVDLRGGGRSTGSAADLTFDVLAADLEAVRGELGAERVAVLGHSVLGILAIEYGRRCPSAVSHVIAVGTPPLWDLPQLAADGARFFDADASDARKAVLRENVARLRRDASPRESLVAQTPLRFFDPRFDAASVFAESEYRPELLAHVMGTLLKGWDIRAGSDSLRVPLLIAHGRYDYTVPYLLWEGLAATLPRTTVRVFGRSGHQPFLEEPEAFGAAVAEWMTAEARRDG
jgi:proline iminopeptidase